MSPRFTLDGNSSSYFLNYDNFSNTPTIPTNNNELTNGAGYITASSTDTLTNKDYSHRKQWIVERTLKPAVQYLCH